MTKTSGKIKLAGKLFAALAVAALLFVPLKPIEASSQTKHHLNHAADITACSAACAAASSYTTARVVPDSTKLTAADTAKRTKKTDRIAPSFAPNVRFAAKEPLIIPLEYRPDRSGINILLGVLLF